MSKACGYDIAHRDHSRLGILSSSSRNSTTVITAIFTKRVWNPISWFIRWALPRSRFSLAISSHCMIVDGDYIIEASMVHGVHRIRLEDALKGATVVKMISYSVEDAPRGRSWAREQIGKRYDWKGAFGLAITPSRSWQEDDSWFCYELCAATLVKSGRDVFSEVGHITETALFAIKQ